MMGAGRSASRDSIRVREPSLLPSLRCPALLTAALLLALGCGEAPFDTRRDVPERGTLGEEVVDLFRPDYAREDARRAEGTASPRRYPRREATSG
jgi:hypothetical protein